mmetsp:Transcript_78645/g.163498  ORF Transcript_78645/g.163498 Transcript_78645/m.163498 type:complete len:250 (+) Transcript_78645:1148-1897(+)
MTAAWAFARNSSWALLAPFRCASNSSSYCCHLASAFAAWFSRSRTCFSDFAKPFQERKATWRFAFASPSKNLVMARCTACLARPLFFESFASFLQSVTQELRRPFALPISHFLMIVVIAAFASRLCRSCSDICFSSRSLCAFTWSASIFSSLFFSCLRASPSLDRWASCERLRQFKKVECLKPFSLPSAHFRICSWRPSLWRPSVARCRQWRQQVSLMPFALPFSHWETITSTFEDRSLCFCSSMRSFS